MNTTDLETYSIPVFFTQKDRQSALKFANLQPNFAKAYQVYLNTLAVCVMYNYLKIMGVKAKFALGDSWCPPVQFAGNFADLEITGLGLLECRPYVGEIQTDCFCCVPAEVQDNRIGYVVIQIEEARQQGNILGFVKRVNQSELYLRDLQPFDNIFEYLASLSETHESRVNLSQWLKGVFEAGWHRIDELIPHPETNQMAYRSSEFVQGAKLINFKETAIFLIILISSQSSEVKQVLIELYSQNQGDSLPLNLQISLLDEQENIITEETIIESVRKIQFEISGNNQDIFTIVLELADEIIKENFIF